MTSLLSIILPVLNGMEESHLKQQLLKYFPLQGEQFTIIENSFTLLTSTAIDPERLKPFFSKLEPDQ